MARSKSTKSRRRKRHVSESDDSESDSDSSVDLSSSDDSESDSDSESLSSSDDSSNDSSSDGSSSEEEAKEKFDDSVFPGEDRKTTEEEVRELIRDAKVMKYENDIIEKAGIDNYAAMRDCDEKVLKKLGMGYTDRDRLLQAFRQHVEGVIEKNRERWERQQELKKGSKKSKSKHKSSKKKGSSKNEKKSSSSKKKSSSRSKSKSSKSSGKKGKSKPSSSKSKSKGKKASSKTPEIDPDEALRKLDTGWSGKRQAWADYKQHEARVAELVEFYDEIGKKRTNAEDHARKLLLSYPGGIHKLVIALDKKYHHIPYGWEDLLEEAYRVQEYEPSGSDKD